MENFLRDTHTEEVNTLLNLLQLDNYDTHKDTSNRPMLAHEYHWDEWLSEVKSIALSYRIWDFIDPTLTSPTASISYPIPPTPPKQSEVCDMDKLKFELAVSKYGLSRTSDAEDSEIHGEVMETESPSLSEKIICGDFIAAASKLDSSWAVLATAMLETNPDLKLRALVGRWKQSCRGRRNSSINSSEAMAATTTPIAIIPSVDDQKTNYLAVNAFSDPLSDLGWNNSHNERSMEKSAESPASIAESSLEFTSPRRIPCICGSKQHKSTECWHLIGSLRPEGWLPRPEKQRKLEIKVYNNKKAWNTLKAAFA
ncbi:hypothetical protein FQN57_005319 [Myotisia sp. PD_48]|nr:hypothetical protein FQN57_005319 [Myotisia sp. PD_48]